MPRREVIAAVLTQVRNLGELARLSRRRGWPGLAEYALILALIAIVAIVALIFLGNQISDKLSIVGNAL